MAFESRLVLSSMSQVHETGKTALVLSGGGSRGAYQVGVLKALLEILPPEHKKHPFEIYVGASAGAINSGSLASWADDFPAAVEGLIQFWSNLEFEQVFRTDLRSLGVIGMQWMKDLSLGGITGGTSHGRSLLDTTPLRHLLTRNIPIHRLKKHIESGALYALTISAINYHTSNTVNFVQGPHHLKMWHKMMRLGEMAHITIDHLMASSAIPIIFPSIEVDGRHFGDGCVRNTTPISPAIHLGATRVIAVGVRHYKEVYEDKGHGPTPSIAQISSVLLNSILLDALELDMGRIERINKLTQHGNVTDGNQVFRPIHAHMISPSQDLGEIMKEYTSQLPRAIRYLLKGLGPDAANTDMMSYLMFEKDYLRRLINLGYLDTMTQKDQILSVILAK